MPFNLDKEFLKGVVSFLTDGREMWICEVLHQHSTNCCYAFASSDTIYTLQYRQYGRAEKVSVQELFDCVHLHYPPKDAEYDEVGKIIVGKGGLGNSARNAFEYATFHGIAFDIDWPFKKEVSSTLAERERLEFIKQNGRRLYISGYDVIADGDHALVCQKLREQSVTTLVLGTKSLKRWKHTDGVYEGPTDEEMTDIHQAQQNNTKLPFNNHIMVLVGFGVDEKGIPFYLAKDSNGEKSGFHGFFKIAQTLCRAFVFPIGKCRVSDMSEGKSKAKGKETSSKKANKGKETGAKKTNTEKKVGLRKKGK